MNPALAAPVAAEKQKLKGPIMGHHLKPHIQKAMEEDFTLRDRLLEIMEIVVSEWESDPQSAQCFDLRIVYEAIAAVKRRKELAPHTLQF